MPSDCEVIEDAVRWYDYRRPDDFGHHSTPTSPSLAATTNREKAKLAEIMRMVAMMMYDPSAPPITAIAYLQQYERLVQWQDALPSHMSQPDNEKVVLPHVLSLQ